MEAVHALRPWDVLCFGDPCVDIVLAADRLPWIGEKIVGKAIGVFAGGTEANVACAVSKLGKASALYGRVGTDAHAGLLEQSLEHFGVAMEHLAVEPEAASACAIAMLTESGERSIVYLPMQRAVDDPAAMAAALRRARIAYAMPYDLDAFLRLSRTARQCGAEVAIDIEAAVAPNPAAMWSRIQDADIVLFNEDGFFAGTGEPPGKEAMANLLRAGPRVIVVSLGAEGAMAIDRTGFASHPAFPRRAIDTTGAGDTFNAAFLVAMMEGWGLHYALRFACAAASHTVTAMGARSGLPDRRAVESVAGPVPC